MQKKKRNYKKEKKSNATYSIYVNGVFIEEFPWNIVFR